MVKGQGEFSTTSFVAIPVSDLMITTGVAHKAARVQCILGEDAGKICFLVIDGEMHRQNLEMVEVHVNKKVHKGLGFSVIMDELPDQEHVFQVYCNKGSYIKDRILKVEVL